MSLRRGRDTEKSSHNLINRYVLYQLLLLGVVLPLIAVGVLHWKLGYAAIALGAAVWVTREWAEGWPQPSLSTSLGWLVGGVVAVGLATIFSEIMSERLFTRISFIAYGCMGMGLAGIFSILVRQRGEKRT